MSRRKKVIIWYLIFCVCILYLCFFIDSSMIFYLSLYMGANLYLILILIPKEEQKQPVKKVMFVSEILEKISINDKYFSEDRFYIYVKNFIYLYFMAYMGIKHTDISLLVEEDFNKNLDLLVHDDKLKKRKRIIEDLKIKGLRLNNYKIIDGYEELEVLVNYKKKEISIDSSFGKKVLDDGNYKDYLYIFRRKIGDYAEDLVNATNCPMCNANNSNFNNGVCIRCGYMIGSYRGFKLKEIKEDCHG